jgi:hypothetical protein
LLLLLLLLLFKIKMLLGEDEDLICHQIITTRFKNGFSCCMSCLQKMRACSSSCKRCTKMLAIGDKVCGARCERQGVRANGSGAKGKT